MPEPPARDVVIVGAGPVGLSLALGLARAGRSVTVLEQEASTADHSRAPAIWPGTQEILADLGVIDRFLSEGLMVRRPQLWDADHDRALLTLPLDELADETRYPHLLILPQSRTERLLLTAVQAEPTADVRFSSRVVALEGRGEPTVTVRCDHGGATHRIAGRFVAGCDGAHSTVRQALGQSFTGVTYRERAALADVRLADSNDLPFPRLTTSPVIAIGIRMAHELWRLILPLAPDEPAALDERVPAAVARLFARTDGESVWQSEFRLHRRIAGRFAVGRVVLAGDAAHLNSPVGGQGMNAGIQDTAALTPALLAALDDDDTRPLTDYAEQRRRQIAAGVNRFTDRMTRVLLAGRGHLLRPAFQAAGAATQVRAVRRRLLRRIAMLG